MRGFGTTAPTGLHELAPFEPEAFRALVLAGGHLQAQAALALADQARCGTHGGQDLQLVALAPGYGLQHSRHCVDHTMRSPGSARTCLASSAATLARTMAPWLPWLRFTAKPVEPTQLTMEIRAEAIAFRDSVS